MSDVENGSLNGSYPRTQGFPLNDRATSPHTRSYSPCRSPRTSLAQKWWKAMPAALVAYERDQRPGGSTLGTPFVHTAQFGAPSPSNISLYTSWCMSRMV